MKILLSTFILILSLTFYSCNSKSDQNTGDMAASSPSDSLVQPVRDISQVVGIGLIVPQDLVAGLAAQKTGTVTHIYKDIGDLVTAGEPIVKLDDLDERLALDKLQQQYKTQTYQVEVAEADLDNTRSQLAYQRRQLNTSRSLLDKGAETRENTDALVNKVETLEASEKLKTATLDEARSRLASLDIDIRQARYDLEKTVIRAPADGQVLKINAVLYAQMNAHQEAVTFAADGPVMARCEIDEMFAGKIRPGQKAEIRNVGFTKVIATGTVTSMSPYLSRKSLFVESPTDQQDRRVRDVRVTLDDPSGLLFNSRIECTIHVNKE